MVKMVKRVRRRKHGGKKRSKSASGQRQTQSWLFSRKGRMIQHGNPTSHGWLDN